MYTQNQYQIDALRRNAIQRTAEQERQARECQRQTNRNLMTSILMWMRNQTNQSDYRPADQTQSIPQVATRSA